MQIYLIFNTNLVITKSYSLSFTAPGDCEHQFPIFMQS